MVSSMRLMLAAIIAAFIGSAAVLPAQASSVPVGAGIALDAASKIDSQQVYHHRRYHRRVYYGRPVYRHRVYHRRPVYNRRYVRPVYYYPAAPVYRRCYVRPRTVWTPYGYERRYVRVCR